MQHILSHEGNDSRFPLRQNNVSQLGRDGKMQFGASAALRNGSSSAYANGANQNCGNVITDRSTTRLHAPPGGRSSICFGDDSAPLPAQPRHHRGQPRDDSRREQPRLQQPREEPYARGSESYARGSESYAHGSSAAVRHGSSNAFANGANQNCGNVLTDRSSTRLHAPPGGGSSFSLGWGGADDRFADTRRAPARAPARDYQPPARESAYQPAPYRQPKADDYAFGANARHGSNAYANGANQNCGNFITDRSTTRLHAPPGGRSSISFG